MAGITANATTGPTLMAAAAPTDGPGSVVSSAMASSAMAAPVATVGTGTAAAAVVPATEAALPDPTGVGT